MPKHTRTHPSRPASPQPKKRRRSPLRVFQSAVYHTTFYLFIIIVGCLVVGSAYGLGEQAVQSGGQSRFNLFVMVAAYVVVVSSLSSQLDFFEELLSWPLDGAGTKRILRNTKEKAGRVAAWAQ